jgi:hypothetical protein
MMANHLVVLKPFLNYVRGDMIADASKVREILSTEYKKFVTKIAVSKASKG